MKREDIGLIALWTSIVWIGLSATVASFPAAADSAPVYVMKLGMPYPGEATNVEMTEEWVTFSNLRPVPDEEKRRYLENDFLIDVEAKFLFTNASSTNEIVGMYFPICDAQAGEECLPLSRESVSVELDGERLEHSFRTVPKGEWNRETQLLFEGEFPASAKKILVVRYVLGNDYGGKPPGDQLAFDYVLESGAKWRGPIGRGTVTVHLPYDASESTVALTYANFGEPKHHVLEMGPRTATMRFEMLEPTAEDDLRLRLLEPKAGASLFFAEALFEATEPSIGERLRHARNLAGALGRARERHAEILSPGLRALFPKADDAAIAKLAWLKFELDFAGVVHYEHTCDEEGATLLGALEAMLEAEGLEPPEVLEALVTFCSDAAPLYRFVESDLRSGRTASRSGHVFPMNRAFWRALGSVTRGDVQTVGPSPQSARALHWVSSVAGTSREDALRMLDLDEKEFEIVSEGRALTGLTSLEPGSPALARFFARYEEATRPDYAAFQHLDQIREPTWVPAAVEPGEELVAVDASPVVDEREPESANEAPADVDHTIAAVAPKPDELSLYGWLIGMFALGTIVVAGVILVGRRR